VAEKEKRDEYDYNLKEAAHLAAIHGTIGAESLLTLNTIDRKTPGLRAAEMMPQLQKRGVTKSSVSLSLPTTCALRLIVLLSGFRY
jgi:hypothetical protein